MSTGAVGWFWQHSSPFSPPMIVFASPLDDHLYQGSYMRLIDEEGNVLLVSARSIEPGDQYLTSDNRLFEVTEVEGEVARARFVEQVELPEERYYLSDLLGLEAAAGKAREPRGSALPHPQCRVLRAYRWHPQHQWQGRDPSGREGHG